MAERADRETLRAATVLRVGDATVLAVERVFARARSGAAGVWAAGGVEPYAVVVSGPAGVRVFELDADRQADEPPEGR